MAGNTNSLVLLGGGGHGSDVLSVVEALGRVGKERRIVFIADDYWDRVDRFTNRDYDFEKVGSIAEAVSYGPFVVSVGFPELRRRVFEIADSHGGHTAAPLIHPGAEIGSAVQVGDGTVIFGNTWISPKACLGEHCNVSYGATIGHDTQAGPFSSIMPSASIGGDVHLGSSVLVGANATILQGVSIGDGAVVAAGAVVTRDVAEGQTVVGCPARAMGNRQSRGDDVGAVNAGR